MDDNDIKRTLKDAGRLLIDSGKAWPRYPDVAAKRYMAAISRLASVPPGLRLQFE